MLDINTSDRKEQRKFGLVMASAFAVLGGVRWALHGFEHLPVLWWSVAVAFLALGLAFPRALQPVFVLWIQLANVLNWLMTRVFLGAAFYTIITPTRLMVKWFGDDPLKRRWLPDAASYWEAPEEQPTEIERYRQQF